MANIGLVLEGEASHALVAALSKAEYDVHAVSGAARLAALIEREEIDAWVFDARSEGVLEQLLATGRYLLPADNIPPLAEREVFNKWVRTLLIQLDLALTIPHQHQQAEGDSRPRWKETRAVWLLAGSAGATGAVQAFLNAFEEPPPVAFIYAQHLDPGQRHQLHRFTLENSRFSLAMAEGAQTLSAGRIVMISPRRKVMLNKFGQIAGIRADWEGEHTPDINELLIILTAARLPAMGAIIFSGMGADGAAALPVFDAAGGRIWAQSLKSAVCPAMPQAAIDTGLVEKCADPAGLARSLEALYRTP